MTLKIAFQGEPGANSDEACRAHYPTYEPVPHATFEDAFEAVKSGACALGMIPLENSIMGRVSDVHHLLPQSGLKIIGERFKPIHFQLMANPGTKLGDVKTVVSMPFAWGQCRRLLRQLGVAMEAASDTAASARIVAERPDPTTAAIAPALAAEIYGLDIIARDIEDEAHNTTRFVVLTAEPNPPAPPEGVRCVTSFVFRVRNIPAALYKALGGFATNGVNMTKLESYMLGGRFTATQFYADVEGHPDDRPVKLALDELRFFSREVKILGTYPGHPFRREAMQSDSD